MKIHLGSGNRYLKGWVNVDLYAEKVDVREDLRTVDFPTETVERILFVHTIEHLSRADGVSVLRKCFDWLRPGGIIEVEARFRGLCIKLIEDGEYLQGAKGLFGGRSKNKKGWHQWLTEWAKPGVSYGCGDVVIPDEWDVPGENHLYVWGRFELASKMSDIGFDGFKFDKPLHHGKRHKRDFRIEATKPCE